MPRRLLNRFAFAFPASCLALLVAGATTGCEDDSAEDAMDDTADALEDAAEDTGDALDDAADDLEDATDRP